MSNNSFRLGDLVAVNNEGYVVPCNNEGNCIGVVVDVLGDGMVNVQFNGLISAPGIVTISTAKNNTLDDVAMKDVNNFIKKLEQKNINDNKTIIRRRLDAIR